MNWTLIISALSGVLGASFGSFFTYRLGNRKQNTTEFEVLVSTYKDLNDQLVKRVDKLEGKVDELQSKEADQEKEIQNLRNQLLIFESSHVDIPLAMWMKDLNGKMIFLNSLYEDMFLTPRGYSMIDYLGANDFSVWSEDVAKGFIKSDKEVMRTKKYLRTVEQLEDGSGNIYFGDILKYPRSLNGKVIGISGIVMRTSTLKEELE